MSSVGQLCRRVDALRTRIADGVVLDRDATLAASSKHLREAAAVLGDLADVLTQLQSHSLKRDSKDPISGDQRYGPATIARIDSALLAVVEATQSAQVWRDTLQSQHQVLQDLHAEEHPITTPHTQYSLTPLAQIEEVQAHELAQEDAEVAGKAAVLRQRRADDAELKKLRVKGWRARIESQLAQLNALATATSPAGLESELSRLDPASCRDARDALLAILENIIARPDEARLRRLRPQHPSLKVSLTHSLAGLRCLCAIGFLLKTEWTDTDEEPPVFDKDPITDEEAHTVLLTEEFERRCALLAVMSEPDLSTSSGLLLWTTWFDRLTALKNHLQQQRV